MSSSKKKKQMPKIGNIGRVIGRPFVKGGPGTGRQPGQVNKFTSLKASFLEAFSELNSTAGLIAWAKASPHNRALFYGWLARMLPNDSLVTMNIEVDTQAAIDAQLKTIADNLNKPDPTPAEWRVLCRECRAANGWDRFDPPAIAGHERSYEDMRKLTAMVTPEAQARLMARGDRRDAEEAAEAEAANAEK